ncbi:MAG: Do family serine endopeptidase, partial [Alphaproteobacteria bacterium]|nr:Do family serine endopeptidase [Alphaproteobacteria bacterium]
MRSFILRTFLINFFIIFLVPFSVNAADFPQSFSELAKKVTPMVVNIAALQSVQRRELPPEFEFNFPPGSPFEELFRRFFEMPGQGMDNDNKDQTTVAVGSGLIVDSSGYIVTNNHVVNDAKEIKVKLTNGKEFPAKLIGKDSKTDLALLKIDTDSPLSVAEFGDSDQAQVGEWVLAVGNPFGLGGSVTAGIISARGRDIRSGPFDDFIQIDAAINRGNSGGPTFNMQGQVIGINTAIFSPNGGSVGIGFAIPSNIVKSIITSLKEQGTVKRGWLGVQIQIVTPELADALNLDKPQGALISEVQPDSPASKAKLKQGDVILSFNNQAITEMRELPRLVATTPIGKKVDIVLWRDRSKVTVPIEIALLDDQADEKKQAELKNDKNDKLNQNSSLGTHFAAI